MEAVEEGGETVGGHLEVVGCRWGKVIVGGRNVQEQVEEGFRTMLPPPSRARASP